MLTTIPGIGIVTSAAYVSVIDDPTRFAKSSLVGAYLSQTPQRYQSAQADRVGRISKCGGPLLRAYLFEAATSLLTRDGKWSALKALGFASPRTHEKGQNRHYGRLTRQLRFSDVLIGLPVLVQQFDLRINGPFSCFG